MVISQNYKLQHSARMKQASSFLHVLFTSAVLLYILSSHHKSRTTAWKFFLYMLFNNNLGTFHPDQTRIRTKRNKEIRMGTLHTDYKCCTYQLDEIFETSE